ncbi:MAG: ribose 5-phosphate isomerase A [Deltaproteobacteria bacterium RBG_16_71_12]|nr:MAG: ribose 5-phosphate isomerase A [Deltaproteobacteria bacterium RBG_16_71_12]
MDELKRQAAQAAVGFVKSGQRIGLGTGSTAKHAVAAIADRLGSGKLSGVSGCPTSDATEQQAAAGGIPLLPWNGDHRLDVAIDGADEVDPSLWLIKGLGGALLREKAVAVRAETFIIVVDESKLVEKLGTKAPLPVEVTRAHWRAEARFLETLGGAPALRGGEQAPFVTDNGNLILDVRFAGGIDDPRAVAEALDSRTHVKAHGLFLEMADVVFVASARGVRRMEKKEPRR